MEALRTQAVCKVACGAWHTAAIASPLPDGGDSLHGLPFIERIAVQHKLAAMYELTEEVPLLNAQPPILSTNSTWKIGVCSDTYQCPV